MSKDHIEILVPVAGRSYPLTVSQEEAEEVMAAAKAIDERIAKLRSQFAVQDRNDLLAMTALQLSIKVREKDQGANATESIDNNLESSIENLLQRLDSAMQG